MPHVRTLIIRFKNEIPKWEVNKFRGALIASLENANVLYHNHQDEGLRYSYPLIQYRTLQGKAAITCIGDGTDAIGEFLSGQNHDLTLGERTEHFEIEDIHARNTLVQCWQTPLEYHIRRWIPLNKENYKSYEELEGITERVALLEKILVGNILSTLKGMGIKIEEQLTCKITWLSEPKPVTFKKVKLIAFDANFRTNVSLPSLIGLGRHVSVGYGTITMKHHNENNNQHE